MQHKIRLLRLSSAKAFHNFQVCCSGIIIISFLSLQVTGCSAMQLSPYQNKPLSSFTNTMPKDNLNIAVQPMTDKAEQEKYFGRILTDEAILPVFIIAENSHSSKSFVLNNDLITLQNKVTKTTYPRPVKTDAASTDGGEAMVWAGVPFAIILFPIGLIVAYTLVFNGGKAIADATVIHHGLVDKGLYTHTISPGKSVEGFVYFKLPDSKVNLKDLSLIVQASELGTKTVQNFGFTL